MTSRPIIVPAGYDRSVRVIEEMRTFTPFGLRLWDFALDTPISDGLIVTARPHAGGRQITARVNRSGIFVIADVPELWDHEHPEPDEDVTTATTITYAVRIIDPRGRFLTAGFTAELPHLGVYPGAGSLAPINGEPIDDPGFPMFSAPTRTTPPGFAAVRARLVDEATGRPAAHAVVRIDVAGHSWFGVSGADGQVVILFPFPTFDQPPATGPPRAGGIPPTDQAFDATVAVRYAQLAADPWLGVPTFDSIRNQGAGRIRATVGDTTVATIPTRIEFGRELVLATQNQDMTVLLIEAA